MVDYILFILQHCTYMCVVYVLVWIQSTGIACRPNILYYLYTLSSFVSLSKCDLLSLDTSSIYNYSRIILKLSYLHIIFFKSQGIVIFWRLNQIYCRNETLPRLSQFADPTVSTSFQKREKESNAYLQQLLAKQVSLLTEDIKKAFRDLFWQFYWCKGLNGLELLKVHVFHITDGE